LTEDDKQKMKDDKKRKLKEINSKYTKLKPKPPRSVKSCITRIHSNPKVSLTRPSQVA